MQVHKGGSTCSQQLCYLSDLSRPTNKSQYDSSSSETSTPASGGGTPKVPPVPGASMEKSDPIIKAYGKGAGLVDDDHGKWAAKGNYFVCKIHLFTFCVKTDFLLLIFQSKRVEHPQMISRMIRRTTLNFPTRKSRWSDMTPPKKNPCQHLWQT